MGKQEVCHAKLTLDSGAAKWTAIYWDGAKQISEQVHPGDVLDVAFRLKRNYFKGMETPQMIIEDLRLAEK
jgi:hypothetical protein